MLSCPLFTRRDPNNYQKYFNPLVSGLGGFRFMKKTEDKVNETHMIYHIDYR